MLHRPESWSKYFFGCFQTFFLLFNLYMAREAPFCWSKYKLLLVNVGRRGLTNKLVDLSTWRQGTNDRIPVEAR